MEEKKWQKERKLRKNNLSKRLGFTEGSGKNKDSNLSLLIIPPENDVRIDFMEDILENEELYADMYRKYAMLRMLGGVVGRTGNVHGQTQEEKKAGSTDKICGQRGRNASLFN